MRSFSGISLTSSTKRYLQECSIEAMAIGNSRHCGLSSGELAEAHKRVDRGVERA